MGTPDRDAAILAANVVAGLNINNTVPSHRDREIFNKSPININDFLPKGARQIQQGHPRQGSQYPPQQQPPQYPPQQGQQYPPQQPQQMQMPQGNHAIPAQGEQQGFTPVQLPNKPLGYIPMDESAQKYAEHVAGAETATIANPASPNFEKPDITGPSFQNTELSSVEDKPDISQPDLQPSSVVDILEEQTKEITALKKKVGTLSTRLYKVIKFIEQQTQPVSKTDDEIYSS